MPEWITHKCADCNYTYHTQMHPTIRIACPSGHGTMTVVASQRSILPAR